LFIYVLVLGHLQIVAKKTDVRVTNRFSLVLPPDGTFGALVNHTWNGMIGMAIKKVSLFHYLKFKYCLTRVKLGKWTNS
jgi:hypothetical protein